MQIVYIIPGFYQNLCNQAKNSPAVKAGFFISKNSAAVFTTTPFLIVFCIILFSRKTFAGFIRCVPVSVSVSNPRVRDSNRHNMSGDFQNANFLSTWHLIVLRSNPLFRRWSAVHKPAYPYQRFVFLNLWRRNLKSFCAKKVGYVSC